MALRYDLDILGDEKLLDDIEALRERASDLKPAFWQVLRRVIVPRYRARFQGGGWEPLDLEYRAWKSKQGLDPKIGRATGALEAALTAMNRVPGRTQTVGKQRVRVGVGKRLAYAGWFDAKRTLFGWEPEDEREALRILDRFLFGRVGGGMI